jgi:hypothetical protein
MTKVLTALRTCAEHQPLVLECEACGVRLQQASADRDVALGTYLQHHPVSPDAVHRPETPPGWTTEA